MTFSPAPCDCRPAQQLDRIASIETLIYIHGDRDSIVWIPAVVQVIAVIRVDDVHVVVVVPIVGPVFRPRVHETEPEAAILEARIAAVQLKRIAVDAEPMILPKMATIAIIGNAVAVIATALLPIAMFGLPVVRPMLLPHFSSLIWLHALPLL
jgi:hypothetical protein